MRNTLFVTCLLSFSLHSFAQVHVASPNHVRIGKESIITSLPGVVEIVDIFGSLYVSQEPNGNPFSGGVYFTTDAHPVGPSPGPGNPQMSYYGPIMRPQWDNHYFLGDCNNQFAEVHSNLVYATNLVTISDKRLKTNVKPVESALSRIIKLQSFYYDLIHVDDPKVPDYVNERKRNLNKNQIGFMAQDIKEDFPFLVKQGEGNGNYAVNYIGFIPEIVRAMQEQQEMIESLKSEVTKLKGANTLKENSVGDFGTSLFGTEKQGASLVKHTPVSVKEEIKINYNLPEGVGQAMLIVCDLTGKQLFKIENVISSNKSVSLPKSKLSAGQYLYTLIANGEEVATHKLIILD